MKKCPFCAEEIQDAAVVCKHCGRDLAQMPLPPPSASPSAPKAAGKPLGIAAGPRLKAAVFAVGLGFLLTFFASPVPMFGFLLIWLGLAGSVVNAAAILQWGVTLILALLILVPSVSFKNAREARDAEQAHAKAIQQRDERTAALKATAKAAADEAARSFPERRASIQLRLAVIENATKTKDWATAQQRLRELQPEVAPLFASTIGQSPEVIDIKNRLEVQQAAISTHTREQQAADAKKHAEEAARAAAAAETARRDAWKPDPILMSVRCARYAKEGVLDGEASFSVETLTKSGRNYIMQGQVIGHNAFNARIAKRAVCKMYMDMKTGTETYTTSTVN